MHGGEVLDADALPLRYAGYSTCFRREAGAAGKDTRGMFRVHQFDKVEMFVFCRPEDSPEEHERLLATEEALIGELGLPYRVVNIAAGDLGAAAGEEVRHRGVVPRPGRYRELTSTSNTTDYQSRRLDVRVSATDEGLQFVHTPERHRRDGPGHARDPRELPGRGRRGLRARGADRLRRPEPDRARRLDGLHPPAGGVPERSKGAVLKTARRC